MFFNIQNKSSNKKKTKQCIIGFISSRRHIAFKITEAKNQSISILYTKAKNYTFALYTKTFGSRLARPFLHSPHL